MTITNEVLDELLSGVENAHDLLGEQGLMKELKVRLMERILGAELSAHLGYEPGEKPAPSQSNRRNGTTRKTVKGMDGAMPIDVPRDRTSHTCKHVLPVNGWQLRAAADPKRSDPDRWDGRQNYRAVCGGSVHPRWGCRKTLVLQPNYHLVL